MLLVLVACWWLLFLVLVACWWLPLVAWRFLLVAGWQKVLVVLAAPLHFLAGSMALALVVWQLAPAWDGTA